MRLNKYIAQAGAASRRKADELIIAGKVKVDGELVTAPYYDVAEGQRVSVEGRELENRARKVYYILNKPPGYLTTTADKGPFATVMNLVRDVPERVFPVGRLDVATSGLLIMTNDGDFAYRITHPKHEVLKTYRVMVSGALSKERLFKLRNGVEIDGVKTAPAIVEFVKEWPHSALVDIKIHEGRNRQVRKMFAAVGCRVTELERIAVGGVFLGRLKQGHIRKMTKAEIELLLGE